MRSNLNAVAKPVVGLKAGLHSAASTKGPVVDGLGYHEALVVASFGLAADDGAGPPPAYGTLTVRVLAGSLADGSDATPITGAAFTEVTHGVGEEAQVVGRLVLDSGLGRYLRVEAVGDGAIGVVASVAIILGSPRVEPVGNTLAFDKP